MCIKSYIKYFILIGDKLPAELVKTIIDMIMLLKFDPYSILISCEKISL